MDSSNARLSGEIIPLREVSRAELSRFAVAVFRSRWQGLLQSIRAAEPGCADDWHERLMAPGEAERKHLAADWFGIEHVAQVAAWDETTAWIRLGPYLGEACAVIARECEDDPTEAAEAVRELMEAEYVLRFAPTSQQDVVYMGWPVNAAYGDWYELTASGFSTGAEVCVMKVTGESFTKQELHWMAQMAASNIDALSRSEGIEQHIENGELITEEWDVSLQPHAFRPVVVVSPAYWALAPGDRIRRQHGRVVGTITGFCGLRVRVRWDTGYRTTEVAESLAPCPPDAEPAIAPAS
jgi:hypothetical protein